MGEVSSRELADHSQPSRLKDLNETLHAIMMDLLQEQQTEADIAERREEIEKEEKEKQQNQQAMAAALAAAAGDAGADPLQQLGGGGDDENENAAADQSSSDMNNNNEIADPFPPLPVPTLGVAVELRNKTTSASGEQVEHVHRVWLALTLPGVGLSDTGAKEASSALTQTAHLELLDLGYNDMTAVGVQHICPALASSVAGRECLRFLRLSGNDIGVVGARAVAEMLGQSCAYLEELQLYNCGITDEGVHALVNALRTHDSIRSINLAKNPTTRKSILMLTQLAKRCKSLVQVLVDVAPSANGNAGSGAPAAVKESDYAELEAALDVNREEQTRRDETRAILEHKARRREMQELAEQRRREEEARGERDKLQARVRELEEQQRQQDDEVRRLAAVEAEKLAQTAARRKAQKAAESTEALDKAMTQAYEWRSKLGVSTGKAAIYRDGFSLYTRQQYVDDNGSLRERMVPYERNPNLLRACWCDPADAAVPYARKLHYHCKFENASVDLLGGGDNDGNDKSGKKGDSSKLASATEMPKYMGCRGTGHLCSSVGFHTKALPNKTAAYFFSSAHPSYQEEEQ